MQIIDGADVRPELCLKLHNPCAMRQWSATSDTTDLTLPLGELLAGGEKGLRTVELEVVNKLTTANPRNMTTATTLFELTTGPDGSLVRADNGTQLEKSCLWD